MDLSEERINEYANSLKAISTAAQTEISNNLWEIWESTGHDLAALQDAFNMIAPDVVNRYRAAASTIGAEFWEEIYSNDKGEDEEAEIDTTDQSEFLYASSGYSFNKHDSEDDINSIMSYLLSCVNKSVMGGARDTIMRNTDRKNGRYARVPTGTYTCAFCLMLASRGFVYKSRETAGEFDKFHHDCDCMVVPSFSHKAKIGGYNPEQYQKMYANARADADSGNTNDILSSMRKLYRLK